MWFKPDNYYIEFALRWNPIKQEQENNSVRQFEEKLLSNMKNMPPEFAKTVDDYFWELLLDVH